MNDSQKEETTNQAPEAFFPVSLRKLIILSFLSFGVYHIHWFYKNWLTIEHKTGKKGQAACGALFAPFCSYGVFREIAKQAKPYGLNLTPPPSVLAFVYFVLWAAAKFDLPVTLLVLLNFLPLVAAQVVVNRINHEAFPNLDPNDNITMQNVVFILSVFAVVMLLALA